MESISIILIVVLAILTIANIGYLIYFNRKSKRGSEITDKESYFKLDAKLELYKYIAITIISVAAFFGYHEYRNLYDDYKEIEPTIEEYKELKEEYANLKELTDSLESELVEIETLFERIGEIDAKVLAIENNIQQDKIQVLLRSLVVNNFRFLGLTPLSGTKPTDEQIILEEERSREMLRNVGFSNAVIDQIIKEAKESNPHIEE